MLSDIDFQHPVFSAFSEPRFGDFTKVRFWNHQRFVLQPEAKARVLARFDDGVPALWEQPVGQGRAFIFASSWRPADSQLALSSKFVPLLSSLLNQAAGAGSEISSTIVVGDPVLLPASNNGEAPVVIQPDGTEIELEPGNTTFTATDSPGIYQIKQGSQAKQGSQEKQVTEAKQGSPVKQGSPAKQGPTEKQGTVYQSFAVNLASMESDTAPLPGERLEQLGVRLGNLPTPADQAERERQLRDIELESRQKLWQWLIVAVIAILGIETLVAARATQKQQISSEVTV